MSEVDSISLVDSCTCGLTIEFQDHRVRNIVDALNEWRLLHECDALKAAIKRIEGFSDE